MSNKQATHIVVQSGLYLGTNSETGRLEEMEIDSQLTLTKKQAEKLEKRGMVKSIKDVEALDVSDADAEASAAEIKTLTEAAEASAAEIKTLTEAAEASAAELETVKANTPAPAVNQGK